ncbi:hypothetical protein GGC64_004376 [Mycobacterium sp. OAS707]|uniref:hypothetical protein n=1 Tax=Mycobacterium sp. OAS707 TaxID=2663822 RepID=UPI00178B3E15|nr:hypothetical protein [Mycobacterium sp. OAS707]
MALAAAPVASADHHGVPHTSDFPTAEGNYTTDGDPGWVYFVIDEFMKPDIHDYFGCGIGPDGTVGCDRVPQPDQYPAMQPKTYPPAGTNQTVATPAEAASYRFSLAPTFTREVDILPEGRQLVNGNAKCSHGLQGSMVCETGEHGFLLSYTRGDNW